MKSKLNKIFLVGFGLLAVVLLPTNIEAASIKNGSPQQVKENGQTKIPITIELADTEQLNSVNLSCAVIEDLDVTCSFENGSEVISQSGDNSSTFVPVTQGSNFTNGQVIANLVLTNSTEASKTIKFKITSSTAGITGIGNPDGVSVTVPAKKAKSDDARLKSLKSSQGKMVPDFSPDVYEYTVYQIADTIPSVNLSAECNDGACNINYPNNNKKVSLDRGSNRIEIVVNPENGSGNNKTYVLNILRGETGYDSSKLSQLSFGDFVLEPAFTSDVLEYTLKVTNETESLVNILKFTKADESAKESLDGFDNLVVGENKATITIDSSLGDSSTTYVITITRMSDQDIEILMYKNREVTFRDSDGIQTTLVEDEFLKEYPEEWKKIQDGTYKFDDEGNIITEEEEKDEDKKEEKKKNNTWIIVLLIVLGLVIIGVSGFFIFKKKKTPVNEEEKEDEEKKNDDLEVNEESNEDGIEEQLIGENKQNVSTDTMNIDEALVDLMSTKQYNFKDED